MISHCGSCGRTIPQPPEIETGHYPLSGPFPTTYTMLTITCSACRHQHRVSSHSAMPDDVHSWSVQGESMVDGVDLKWGNTKYKGEIDGSKPLDICWGWIPFYENTRLTKSLIESIRSEEAFRRADGHSLLVMEFDRFAPGMMGVISMFDGVVLLKKHMMAGAVGPYPSLRAEKSIVKTFAASNLRSVKHYWPSITLQDRDYVELADDATIGRMCSRASRRGLTIERIS